MRTPEYWDSNLAQSKAKTRLLSLINKGIKLNEKSLDKEIHKLKDAGLFFDAVREAEVNAETENEAKFRTLTKCGKFVPGGACSPTGYAILLDKGNAADCIAACEAQAFAGCCWHRPNNIGPGVCQWVVRGRMVKFGEPKLRESTQCTIVSKVKSDIKRESKAKVDIEREAKAEHETKVKAEHETKVNADIERESKAKAEAEREAKAEAEHETKAKADIEREAKDNDGQNVKNKILSKGNISKYK